jgi:hypothetical protein
MFSGNPPQQWGKGGRSEFVELPGDDAPAEFYEAFDRINAEVFNNELERIPIRVNTGKFNSGFVSWYGDHDAGIEFMGFWETFPNDPEYQYEYMARNMAYVTRRSPPPPSEPAPSAEPVAETADETAAEPVYTSTYWSEPMSEYEPEFEEIPNSAPVRTVSEPVVQPLTVVEPAPMATPAPVARDMAPQRLPGALRTASRDQSAARDMAPQRLPVAAPAVEERPAEPTADITAELLALGRQIAARLNDAVANRPAPPPPTDATAEFLDLGLRIVAHLDAAAAHRQQARRDAEPLTVTYSSPRPKPAASPRRRQDSATVAKIAAIYAASPSPLAPPADASQPHLLALPRPMDQPMQPIFTGGQRRVIIPRSNHGK